MCNEGGLTAISSIPYINNVYIAFTFMHIKFYYYFEVTCAKAE
jgi:hypothetical protein